MGAVPIPFAMACNPQMQSAAKKSVDNSPVYGDMPAHKRPLVDFMRQLHLQQYIPAMFEQGYDDLNFMSTLTEKELQDVANLVKMLPGHATKFVVSMTKNISKDPSAGSASKARSACRGGASSASSSSSASKGDTVVAAGVGDGGTAAESGTSYVVCIVDRSGSMQSMGSAVKNGFNEFLQQQKAFPGACLATVVRFDNKVEIVNHGTKLADISPATDETFAPRGSTALYDALGDSIAMVKEKISTLSCKPSRVMVLVLTDGQENASSKHSHSDVVKNIKQCEDELKWSFVYIGANQNAITTGARMGFRADSCLTYAADHLHQRATWSNISSNLCRQRGGGSASWTHQERMSSMSSF